MSNGIRSLPRYQTGGPTRRDFIKRMLGGLGGLFASRFGFPGGDEVEQMGNFPDEAYLPDYDDLGDVPVPLDDWQEQLYWVKNRLRAAGIDLDDVPEDVLSDFMDEVIPLPDIDFGSGSPELEDIWDSRQLDRLDQLLEKNDPKVIDDLLDRRYKYNKKLDELLASGDARFIRGHKPGARKHPGGFVPEMYKGRHLGPSVDPEDVALYLRHYAADPEDVARYQELRRLSQISEARGAAERQARRGGEMFFGPSYNRPGILDSPSVRPSPSTAGRWAGRRGLMSLLGVGAASALTSHPLAALTDVMISPTRLGSGDIPREDPFTDEEKIKYYRDLSKLREELGVGLNQPSILQLSREINGPSIRSSYPMGR